jgi:hypothetical protein
VRARAEATRSLERQIEDAVLEFEGHVNLILQTSGDLIYAGNVTVEAMNEAVELDTAGNFAEARRRYSNQALAIIDLEDRLKREQETLERARDALSRLEEGHGS